MSLLFKKKEKRGKYAKFSFESIILMKSLFEKV